MNLFRNRFERVPSSNSIGAGQDSSLPIWAGSADFRDFERGADRRSGFVLLDTPSQTALEGAVASQTSDGARDRAAPGVEAAGWIVQKAKKQILDQARISGLADQDAKYLYERLDELPNSFFFRNPGLMNTTVTPDDDRAYRQKLEEMVPEPQRQKRFLDAYRRRFQDGTLKWGR